MPPKKAGKKKQSEESEQARRLFELQRHLNEVETRLKEARRSRSKLSREKAGMLQQLTSLEEQVQKAMRDNAETVSEFQRKQAADEKGRRDTLDALKLRLFSLSQSLMMHEMAQTENARLRAAVESLDEECRQQRQEHVREEEELKKEAFDMRMQLENVSRKTLKEMNSSYEARAMEEMLQESESAHQQNLTLQRDLADQSAKVTRLMMSQQQRNLEMRALKMERDMMLSANSIQLSRLDDLTESKAEHEEVLTETQAHINELRAANAELREHERSLAAAKHALDSTEKQVNQANHEAAAAKAQVVKLARRLLSRATTTGSSSQGSSAQSAGGGPANQPAGAGPSSVRSSQRSLTSNEVRWRRAQLGSTTRFGSASDEGEDEEESTEAIWSSRFTSNAEICFLSDTPAAPAPAKTTLR